MENAEEIPLEVDFVRFPLTILIMAVPETFSELTATHMRFRHVENLTVKYQTLNVYILSISYSNLLQFSSFSIIAAFAGTFYACTSKLAKRALPNVVVAYNL